MRLKPYQALDTWRGIASLWVVMFHSGEIITDRFPSLAHQPLYLLCSNGYLGVQMFFVISGYCIANAAGSALRRDHGLWQFLRARGRRIYPPYWIALAFYALLSLGATALIASGHLKSSVLAGQDLRQQPALYFASNLTLSQAIFHQTRLCGVAWTLCYEIFFYLIIGIALLALKRRGEPAMLSALHGLTVAALLLLLAVPQYRFYPLDMWPQFGLGILAYDWLRHPDQKRPRVWAAASALLLLAFTLLRDVPIGTLGQTSRSTFLVSLIFAGMLVLFYRYDGAFTRNRVVRVIGEVGLFSYSLYLIHVPCLGLFNQAVKAVHLQESLAGIWFAASLLAALAAGRLFYHLFERPFLQGNRAAKLEPSGDLSLAVTR